MSTVPRQSVKSSRTVALLACVGCLAVASSLVAGGVPGRADAGAVSTANNTVTTPTLDCGSGEVTTTLASGSAWRMCARIDSLKGLVLEQVQFRPATGDRESQGW